MNKKTKNLDKLKNIKTPAPSKARRAASIEAAMLAFDIEQQKSQNKNNSRDHLKNFQGNTITRRLMSIFNNPKRTWIMDMRIPVGAVMVGMVILPAAWYLNNNYSEQKIQDSPAQEYSSGGSPNAKKNEHTRIENDSINSGQTDINASSKTIIGEVTSEQYSAPAPNVVVKKMPSTSPRMAQESVAVQGFAEDSTYLVDERHFPQPIPSTQDGDRFSDFENSPLFTTAQNPVSTFSIDVDTASYSYVRRQLEDGFLPNENSVRIEEMINYFSYDYKAPSDESAPFSQSVAVYPTPWNEATKLLHIGIKGFTPEAAEIKPSNLVLLIDTSGSMSAADKLPLLKRSFALLLNQLNENDTISIVAYAGSAGVVLKPTAANKKTTILGALDRLQAGGSTAGGEGIELAYQLAKENASNDVNSRVILATDGDFNVGISTDAELKKFIEKKRNDNIFLSVLGFGTGNYNDALMQSLAQNGNGNAYYIDNFLEAQKVLGQEVQGTLTTIAKDVKIQVEFNPATVAEYRLVGYETRALKREDFNNDKVDAGDIGAGHTVTAIYEITPVGSSAVMTNPLRYESETKVEFSGNDDEYAFLKLRYKLPNEDKSKLIEQPVPVSLAVDDIAKVDAEFRFGAAVAAFAQKLRYGSNTNAMTYAEVKQLGEGARGADKFGYRAEFISLVDLARSLSDE